MTVHAEQTDLRGIIDRLCEKLLSTIASRGNDAAELRRQIGELRTNALEELREKTFAATLLAIFSAARSIPVQLEGLARVRKQLQSETATGEVATAVIQTGIVYCLATESRLISTIEFSSQNDVESMIAKMRIAFDEAREMAADAMDSTSYQAMTLLAGALMNHLANAARQLPRIVTTQFNDYFPALYLSQRIYQDASRYDELLAENKTIHPLFMQRSIVSLAE